MIRQMQQAVERVTSGKDLETDLAAGALTELMDGKCSNALIGAFLAGLKLKGESSEEIAAFARVMREKSVTIDPDVAGGLIDVCGTGGAPVKTFNVSTIAAFVIAGAGQSVAKHGNRSNTSKSGSADVLESLGVNLDATPEVVEASLEEVGIGFLYAPNLHPAMKYAAKPRRELGIRSVFNILGPLTNPAGADFHLMGVFNRELVKKFPHALRELGVKQALVVHGSDGVDEITLSGESYVGELANGNIKFYKIHPQDFGMKLVSTEKFSDIEPQSSAKLAVDILKGNCNDERYKMVILNAGAGIYISGRARNINEGIERARESIRSGAAYDKLVSLVKKTGGSLKVGC